MVTLDLNLLEWKASGYYCNNAHKVALEVSAVSTKGVSLIRFTTSVRVFNASSAYPKDRIASNFTSD